MKAYSYLTVDLRFPMLLDVILASVADVRKLDSSIAWVLAQVLQLDLDILV